MRLPLKMKKTDLVANMLHIEGIGKGHEDTNDPHHGNNVSCSFFRQGFRVGADDQLVAVNGYGSETEGADEDAHSWNEKPLFLTPVLNFLKFF